MTGGLGFIGSWITMELIKAGHQVTILARNPDKIPHFRDLKEISMVKGGLEDRELIRTAMSGHDAVLHNALFWGDSLSEMLQKDTAATVFLAETAGESGISQFLYTSSTAALGEFRPEMHEEMRLKPIDAYGASKAASEGFILAASRKYSMRCNIIRPGYTVANPVVPLAPMEIDSRFRDIVRKAVDGTEIELDEFDGTQFIWAGDLAKIFRSVLETDGNRRVYFGLSKEFVTWEAVAREAVKIAGTGAPVTIRKKDKSGEACLFELKKIRDDFGYEFKCWEKIREHIEYLIGVAKS